MTLLWLCTHCSVLWIIVRRRSMCLPLHCIAYYIHNVWSVLRRMKSSRRFTLDTVPPHSQSVLHVVCVHPFPEIKYLKRSTGAKRATLPKWRIKAGVVPAGHSPQLAPSRDNRASEYFDQNDDMAYFYHIFISYTKCSRLFNRLIPWFLSFE